MTSYWTPQTVEWNKNYGGGLMKAGTDASPVGHWTQALARVLQGGVGGYMVGQANEGERAGKQAVADIYKQGLEGGKPMSAIAASLMGAPGGWGAEQGQALAKQHMVTAQNQGFQREQQDRQFKQQRDMAELQHRNAAALPTDPIKEFRFAKSQGFQGSFEDWKKQGQNNNASQNITWGRDAAGNWVPMQATRSGELVASRMPANVKPVPVPDMAEAKAAATERGKAAGEAVVNLPTVENNARAMLDAIEGVERLPNLERMTGWSGNLPNVTPSARDAQAKIDQIQGQSFLQAFAGLRGGGQITEAEGAKATAALSRLAETRVGTPQYRQALADLRREVEALRDLARRKAGVGGPSAGGAPAAPSSGGWSIRRLD